MEKLTTKRTLQGTAGVAGVIAIAAAIAPMSTWAQRQETAAPASPPSTSVAVPSQAPVSEAAKPIQQSVSKAVSGKKTKPAPAPSSLPGGLMPAHSQVYWEDSEACRNFVTGKIQFVNYDGSVEPFVVSPERNRAIGCTEGYAAIAWGTDLATADSLGTYDEWYGNLLAKWDGSSWTIDHFWNDGEYRMFHDLWSFPQARAFKSEPDTTALKRVQEDLDNLGVTVSDINKLMGPNVPSWHMEDTSPWTGWTSTYFSGQKREGWQFREQEVGGDGLGFWATSLYDANGSKLFGLDVLIDTPPEGPLNGACELTGNYRIEESADIALESDTGKSSTGKLKIALVTVTDEFGNVRSDIRLIPAGLKKKGGQCNLPLYLEIGGHKVSSSVGGPIGFEKKREVKDFVKSTTWTDVVEFAQSLRINPETNK